MNYRTTTATLGGIAASILLALPATAGSINSNNVSTVSHVLLISIDGMHQSDLAWYVETHPKSTLAALMAQGVDFSNASTPFPSDSFPGMVGQLTGGNPRTTGIYYDDTWNHAVFPAGTTNCSGPVPGGEVTYFEARDINKGALDAGQGLVPAPGKNPWANILEMTGNPLLVINRANLIVNPSTCLPIYPNTYLQVNTVFEVAHADNLLTAWSDKHPAYMILSGPSGQGVDDYFTPEINSSAIKTDPIDPNANDWTTNNLFTQQYDNYKVEAVVNWINGHSHDGTGNPGTPAIFGMNFQTVSTGQKLPTSPTEGDPSGNAQGGYLADGFTPGVVLTNALDFVDKSLGEMVSALTSQGILSDTAIIISAKHGQCPMNVAALNRISDSQIISAMNAAWAKSHGAAKPLVALGVDDDGILLWLSDRSDAATDFASQFLSELQRSDGQCRRQARHVCRSLAGIHGRRCGAAHRRRCARSPGTRRDRNLSQYGVVYTSHKAKIAEHGGDHLEDRNVPILVEWRGSGWRHGRHGAGRDDADRPNNSAATRS